MKMGLIQIEKTTDKYIIEGTDIYIKRLKNYVQLTIRSIKVPKNIRQRTVAEQKLEEANLILKNITQEDYLVLLDENGIEYNSLEFSNFIKQKQNSSIKSILFLIGGPFGFDKKIYERANTKVSLSKMTFSHQMVRLFFLEQLYRSFTITKGEKYHHS